MKVSELQARIVELEAQLEFWKRAYRKSVSHDGRIIQHLKEASDESQDTLRQ